MNRVAIGCLAAFAFVAGGAGSGVLPSSQYVAWALGEPDQSGTQELTFPEKVIPAKPKVAGGPTRRIDFPAIARREALRAGIRRPELFVRQIAQESNFDPCAGSPAGAQGIAQIMPSTAKGWGVDPWMPSEALRAAAIAMAKYEKRYGNYAVALQAYNAGPGAVARYKGQVPYGETKEYVRRIMGDYPLSGVNRVYVQPTGYTPKFARSVRLLIKEVNARGGSLGVVPGNGFRSVSTQTRLWKEAKKKHGTPERARRWVAPPFCSNHGKGNAADFRGDLRLAHTLGPKYGVHFRMKSEPWHGSQTGY